MPRLEFEKANRIWLINNPEHNEKWVQERIAEDPTILGLGELILRDKERTQPAAGRLDLLLQDPETDRRYEVEIQLGKTDESHIIRTIEYWDIERKRYPQYDHCAVIVAEEITSRFLNVISLFNGTIPLIAIQMNAFEVKGAYLTLVFTKVLGEMARGPEDEDEEKLVTDRIYWENQGSSETVAIADDILAIIRSFAPKVSLKYNKFYIGLSEDGRSKNFVWFRAKKNHLICEANLPQTAEWDAKLANSDIDQMPYDKRNWSYRVRLTKQDFHRHKNLLSELVRAAYEFNK
jgi:hypothetical protein